MIRPILAMSCGAIAAIAILSGASAAKSTEGAINVDCGDDGTLQVLSYGNGGRSRFTPVHIVGTNKVLIPVAFTNGSGTFTDNEGHVETFTEDDSSRGAPANADLMDCHYSVSFTTPDGTVAFEGDVEAYIPGK